MLSQFDLNDPDLVSAIDETPLWSAPFGLALLDRVVLKPYTRALDVGCGLGFPALELAQRLGPSSQVYALDPWQAALDRVALKRQRMGIGNVTLLQAEAEAIPVGDACFDLIVSNNGLNNVNDPAQAWAECFRVAKAGAQAVVTENTPDTMAEFYGCLRGVLTDLDLQACLSRVEEHIHHKRKTLSETKQRIEDSGFQIVAIDEHEFRLRYVDGTAMFNHFLIRLAFLEDWVRIVPEQDCIRVFKALEDRLNEQALEQGELTLTIPFVCIDACKP
jgi:ubiquinone/menaquinone biosynthesis C-methylase UbiE